jgi:leucyl aminopeptidase
MRTQLSFAKISEIETELLAVVAADTQTAKGPEAKPAPSILAGDAALVAAAASVLASGEFKAGANETLLIHAPAGLKAKRLLVVGVGKAAKISADGLRQAAGTAVRFGKPRGIKELSFSLPKTAVPDAESARAVVEGALLGDFDADTYRSDRKDKSIESFTLATVELEKSAAEAGLAEGVIFADSQNFARTLVHAPGNKMTPTILAEKAAEMAAEVGLKSEISSTEKIKELKMGAFWSVAQGSAHVEPPALIVLRYEPEGVTDGPVLGLVGKGLTFDSGGISIKPSSDMDKMKSDMAGGAAMLGAMRAIALLKPKVRVIAVVCATENMPDGNAQKPGDVQTAMSGKTIEILNTDAEGRLVLADGITYAKQLGATHLIDAATLTGACVVALGMVTAGSFSNDDATYAKFAKAVEISGEKFWRLPIGDEYAGQIKSDIADIKNTGGRWGGAITAAEFLHVFAEETPWIHLDIAGLALTEDSRPYVAKCASGVAVRSIVEWTRQF